MTRLVVTDPKNETESPFLRGILTSSLQDVGLSFDEAYRLSSQIRQNLLRKSASGNDPDRVELTVRQLQARIIKSLRREGFKDALKRYRSRRSSAVPVAVRHKDGSISPFSRADHQRVLQCSGLPLDEAMEVTVEVYDQVLADGTQVVASSDLDSLTHSHLKAQLSSAVARRYLVWRDFVLSGRPLLLLIGGAAGCGKSTITNMIASRLDIVRTQSTDMLREVMRVMVAERLLPVLHASSFDAWRALPRAEHASGLSDDLLTRGFRAQADLIAVACEAVIQRAITERVSLILEGVHVEESLLNSVPDHGDALVVPIMLGVLDAKTLRARIRGRGRAEPARRSARYLQAFDEIWRLQSYLLSQADRAGIPIVNNTEVDQVFTQIMHIILDRLTVNFSRTADEVFKPSREQAAHR